MLVLLSLIHPTLTRILLYVSTGVQNVVGAPSQGTILIDLSPDDPEFISVKDQVRQSSL